MNYPSPNDLIQRAAFDYLSNAFSQNPAQPLVQKPGQQPGGTVQQPQAPPNNVGKVSGIMGLLNGGGAGGGAAAGGF